MCGPPMVPSQDFLNRTQAVFFFQGEEEQQRPVSLYRVCTTKHQGWESPHC